jgi:hypothetical protein
MEPFELRNYMRKIWTILAPTVLAIVLLMGMVSATDTASVTLTGCLLEAEYAITTPPDGAVDLILLKDATALVSDSMGVTAAGPWKLQVKDQKATDVGYMMKDVTHLSSPLSVKVDETAQDLTQERQIANGDPGCNEQTVNFEYQQPVGQADESGTYSISITYTLSYNE